MNNNDRVLIDLFEKRLSQVEDHQITANSELGDVKEKVGFLAGRVGIILWLMGGTFLVVVGHFIYTVYFSG